MCGFILARSICNRLSAGMDLDAQKLTLNKKKARNQKRERGGNHNSQPKKSKLLLLTRLTLFPVHVIDETTEMCTSVTVIPNLRSYFIF